MLAGWHVWVWSGAVLGAALLLAFVAHRVIFFVGRRVAQRTGAITDDALVRHLDRPARFVLPLLALVAALPATSLAPTVSHAIQHGLGLGLIAAAAWTILVLFDVLEDVLAVRYKMDVDDNLRARKIRTQVQVLRRTAAVVVGVVALSVMLMTFPTIRQFGVSLFASAGVAGLVVGMAARPTLSSLLAGLQIALTEPIRIDDVVVIEGEWGRIEEITTTYVVVRIWDLRRLVVPLSYFIQTPFQNWTRVSADILGTVFLYTDYTVPVDEVRRELQRVVSASDLWNGQVCGLQVTDAREHTMELRALMSSADSSKSWDLRCHVREQLIRFLQSRYPQSLPRTRVEVDRLPAPGATGSHDAVPPPPARPPESSAADR
jgi:small-conductance mechanosensitive channel